MDPEDLREIISAYQKCVAEIVKRFGGFVAKYMGDGVLIYFGYPQAHEDDCRHRNGPRGRRRPDRLGRFSGESRCSEWLASSRNGLSLFPGISAPTWLYAKLAAPS
jgi:class 3 adenylate cyclase